MARSLKKGPYVHPRSRTGLYAKGKKTRNQKKPSTALIISRRPQKSKKK
jgi:hypothetical protein